MQLNKKIQITVFKLNNTEFEPIGDLSQFTSIVLPDAFIGYGIFELWAPIMDINSELLKKGNIIWAGGENAYIIEVVKSILDKNGNKTYHVKGRSLERFLCDRVIWGTYIKTGYASTIMYDLVDKNFINPTNAKRKLPWLINATDTFLGNSSIEYQQTGGDVYDALSDLAVDSDIGFSINFDPRNKRLVFEVREGVDRTVDNVQGNDPVVFSTDLEDILSSTYYTNNEDEKTMAFIQGEDRGAARKSETVGAINGIGFNRRELYVDARDLQSEVYHDDGTVTVLTDAQYRAMLRQRGNEKMAEHEATETFDAQIRQFGDVQYEFGVDYVKGDKVTVIDNQLMVKVSARITSVEEDFSDEYALILTFGYSYPTVLSKVKRAIR